MYLSLSASLVLLGCGAGPIAATSDGTETSASSDPDTSGDGDGDPGDGDGDGDPGDGDGDPGDGDGDPGDGDGDPLECAPSEPVTARFTVSPATARTATCTVTEQIYDGDFIYYLELDCDGTPVRIDVESTIAVQPYAGEASIVELDYRTDPNAPNDHWLAIHRTDADALVLGGVSASQLDPPGTTLAEFFRNPGLSVATEQPCAALTDSCGDYLRLALDVTVERFGLGGQVFDHGSWYANYLAFGFSIEVESATRRVPPNECDDAPDEWFALLVVWFPSD
jgi:hypothetical protein